MNPNRAADRVERYRDDIVTHGDTAKAMTTVVEAARVSWIEAAKVDYLREGIEQIIADRYAGNFDGLIPKMRALLDGELEVRGE